ncbi:DUF1016 N-terminal domain-containing protein, partial [Halomonas sp.]|uniref:DUF1016 N-terminal domain-containing protein n=1 Tax=Halomonas sp. TaxID=1486246 RepID=UPI0035642E29
MTDTPGEAEDLVNELRGLIDSARQRAAVAVNAELTLLYWQIGRRIHREILAGKRAGYGEEIVSALGRQRCLSSLLEPGIRRLLIADRVEPADLPGPGSARPSGAVTSCGWHRSTDRD